MNKNARCESFTNREPLPVELLLPADKRRITIDDHAAWQASFHGPARMRSTGEVSRLMDLLDELDGKDGQS